MVGLKRGRRPAVLVALMVLLGLVGRIGPAAGADPLDSITTADDFRQPHADVLRLYFAVFDRAPDLGGARYWIARYDDGATIAEIANHMTHSPEFVSRYGGTSPDHFVTALYENVLDRPPDAQGYTFWVEGLTSGRFERLYVLRHFAASGEFTEQHRFPGEDSALPGPPLTRPVGTAGPIIGFSVEVEPALGWAEGSAVAEIVAILGDRRSWIGDGSVRFRWVEPDDADVRIRIARPGTVDARCSPLRTNGFLSCRNGRSLNINSNRWARATSFWTAPLGEYRAYVINHEMGHFLGHGHVGCPGRDQLAPVMQQQTKGLAGCVPNGWPHP